MKKTIFLTGATGTMGHAGMNELLRYPDRYDVRVLARPSQKNKALLEPLAAKYPALSVVWGDLTRYEDVLRGVTGADVVLHVGGMVSPAADYRPKATYKTNITAAPKLCISAALHRWVIAANLCTGDAQAILFACLPMTTTA